ncbi:MAG: transcription elongation factor GreA, partial [Candidatus Harrisonbacteria bacterium]|nr:transcription elongation factor GreA [Candidatus Harrisonbacteria bacterium]
KSDALRKRDSGPVYLTEEGLRAMREALAHLKQVLPARIAETARTAAYGDRSDNAEYKEAKGMLRRTHWRILNIEEQLKRVEVIPSGVNASGTVQLGSTVVLEHVGKQTTFHIVGPLETDPGAGRISHLSPLGAALINHRAGDTVTITTHGGAQVYRIVEIR